MDFPAEGKVTLICSVTSSSSSGWKFFWYKGEKTSEPLTKQDAVLLSSGQITVSRGGVYWCRGGRGEPLYYTDYSHSVVTNRAVVSLQPNWPEIYSGETITLTCEIEDGGDTEWEYEWRTSSSTTPPKRREYTFKPSRSEDYGCKGLIKGGESSTKLSDVFTLTPSSNKPEPVLTVSPSWLSPGDSVTLNCRVKHPSAGWRFSWYKAVPKPSDNSYSYELLPDSTTGTEQDSYIVHGQTHTAGYVCRAGRGDPVYHTDYSKPQFVWSGDFGSSASLTVSPDRVQHFTSDSVSLSCEGNSTEWRVRRFTDGYLSDCSIWGTMTGPTCKVDKSWLSGVYWCESGTGEFSNAVNITIEYGHIILLSPVRPVTEGRSVTLGCKLKTQNDIYNVVFYKNGKIIQNDTRGELIISAVSKSDEGFYKCKGDNSPQGWSVTSPESWMSVKLASRPENNLPLLVVLVVGLVGGDLLIILLLLFLLLCCYRKSKDSCFNSRSQRSNQSPATDQEGSHYASLSHGDLCLYDTIRRPEEPEKALNMLFYCRHAQGVLLTIEPNWSTVFTGESVTFMCDTSEEKGDNWYYKINRGDQEVIGYNKKENHTEQLQTMGFSGEYQCSAHIRGSIKGSNKVSLTASDKDVILETPASALFDGQSVILRCRHRDPTKNKNAVFYKDGSAVEMDTNLQSQMMKNTVQVISDRSSIYMCKFGDEESEPIKLTTEPQPKAKLRQNFPAEGNVTLICSVATSSSSGWKFFWYKGEKTSEPLTKQDAVLLSSGQITVSRGGVYWCRGGRGEPLYYTEYSHSVVTNRAVVSLQPNWPEIYSGETITLTCEIEYGGVTEWEYEWRTRSSTTPQQRREYTIKPSHSEDFWCMGRPKGGKSGTVWSDVFTSTPSSNKPEPVLTVSPSWLSPGDLVTLNCSVKHPSAGWRFSWYKAVPKPSDNSYSYELLPDSTTGTEQDSYIVHGQTHTAGYVCRAGRGDPVDYTYYSEAKFVWSGDFHSSASLTVSPDRVQHFTSDSVSLSCEGNSTEWRVRRFTDGYLSDCSTWGTMTGSTCKMDKYLRSGVYWCESETGQFSNAVNITNEYDNIILLSPVLPVTEGRSVTLGCKLKTQNDIYNVVFYKNGKIIQNDTRGELIISAASKSDEGFYKCKGDNLPQARWSRISPESWISIKLSEWTKPIKRVTA
ncbi:uncharacterized protein LOC131990164 [Centropristis striata]|uniref:uncharacterized protein LOC131990164 n=1 Tax=Centropristis striata TaxID=184440 RepID=UPI0027E12DBD|nr:uncharacterized protein LOC131990164 [Centropristis striata]